MFDFKSPLTYIGFFFLLAFVLISLQHIYYCYKEWEAKRKLTKTLCVPALAIAAVFLAPMRWQIYVGAIVGAIGDYFLLKKHFVKFLALGMLFFFLGHIFYINEAMSILVEIGLLEVKNIQIWAIVYFVAAYAIFFTIAFIITKKKWLMSLAGGLYCVSLLTETTVGLVGVLLGQPLFFIFLLLGGLVFLMSDSMLVYSHFFKPIPREHFPIMITYLLGEVLIVVGLILTNGVIR